MPPPTPHDRSDAPTALFAGALVAVLHPLRFGYQYGTGDHDDLLPPILARLEPGLFALDVYVQSQLDGITVRTAFQTLVRSLASVIGLPTAVGLLHLLVAVGVGAGVCLLARAMRGGRTGSVLAALLACVAVPGATVGGNAVIYSLLTPEGIAWALVIPAMALFVRKRRLPAAVLLGVAAWFHLLAAGLVSIGLILVAVAEAAYKREGWKTTGAFAGLAALVAAPIAVPALLRQSAEAGAHLPDGLDPFTLYAVLRFPHHYLPGGTSPRAWLLFGAVAAAGITGFVLARRSSRPPDARFPLRFGTAAVWLIVFAMIGVLAADSLSLARAQTLKLTVVLNVLACVGVATGAMSRVPKNPRKRTDQVLRRNPGLLITAGLVLFLLGIPVRWTPDRDPATDVARWAFTNTPRETLFAVPPSLSGFRVHAERSVVATWKAVPFRTDLAADWWTRIAALSPLPEPPTTGAGLAEALDAAHARQSDEERRALATTFGAEYAIVPVGAETALPVVHRTRRWAVLRLP